MGFPQKSLCTAVRGLMDGGLRQIVNFTYCNSLYRQLYISSDGKQITVTVVRSVTNGMSDCTRYVKIFVARNPDHIQVKFTKIIHIIANVSHTCPLRRMRFTIFGVFTIMI